jgi:CelD/BcsL family acetyltransferase involved in cellulose biosynthesis
MKYEIIRSFQGWSALKQEWHELLERSRSDSIFMTSEWLDSWLELRASGIELLIICVRSASGELIGAAANYVVEYRLLGVLKYRVLRSIGDTESGAEYQTWIADRSVEDEVLREIVDCLLLLGKDWDLVWMPNLDGWSGINEKIVEAALSLGLWVNHRPCVFSAFKLPETYDSFLQSFSSNRRQQLRRMGRKILGKPEVEIRRVGSRDQLRDALGSLFDLHGRRWQAAGERGVFASKPLERDFYAAFANVALERGWLALYLLLDSGTPKAVQFGYVYKGAFLQMQEGFDPEYFPQVGNVLRAHVIEDCIQNGVSEYDFLGGVSEHKRRWLAEERRGMDLLIARRSLKTLPIRNAEIWPTGKYLKAGAVSQFSSISCCNIQPSNQRHSGRRFTATIEATHQEIEVSSLTTSSRMAMRCR